jgi:N-hydroxyarylamine O-acetyltransferase
VFDLPAYLRRIGLAGQRPDLASLHRAHVCSIPFENLDPLRGVSPSLDVGALQHKMVGAERGGYCFEQNLLFRAALEASGMAAEPMLARVRWGRAPGTMTPLTHLALRVRADGGDWLADVGFGGSVMLDPVPFGPGGPWKQSGWCYRVVEEGDELVVQTSAGDGDWRDMYAFAPRPVPQVDIELGNWWTSTHPSSQFVTGFNVARPRVDGTRVSLGNWDDPALVVRKPGDVQTTAVERAEIPALLAEHFGLRGFTIGQGGRLALTRGS